MSSSTSTKQRPERAANTQPNALPEGLPVEIISGDTSLATITVPQADKLSAKGNILFTGGVRKGLRLPGDEQSPVEALEALSYAIDGEALTRSSSGVHASSKTPANSTVCHTSHVEMPVDGGEPVTYMVMVQTTFVAKRGSFNLNIRSFPAGGGVSGPAVVGEIDGELVIDEA